MLFVNTLREFDSLNGVESLQTTSQEQNELKAKKEREIQKLKEFIVVNAAYFSKEDPHLTFSCQYGAIILGFTKRYCVFYLGTCTPHLSLDLTRKILIDEENKCKLPCDYNIGLNLELYMTLATSTSACGAIGISSQFFLKALQMLPYIPPDCADPRVVNALILMGMYLAMQTPPLKYTHYFTESNFYKYQHEQILSETNMFFSFIESLYSTSLSILSRCKKQYHFPEVTLHMFALITSRSLEDAEQHLSRSESVYSSQSIYEKWYHTNPINEEEIEIMNTVRTGSRFLCLLTFGYHLINLTRCGLSLQKEYVMNYIKEIDVLEVKCLQQLQHLKHVLHKIKNYPSRNNIYLELGADAVDGVTYNIIISTFALCRGLEELVLKNPRTEHEVKQLGDFYVTNKIMNRNLGCGAVGSFIADRDQIMLDFLLDHNDTENAEKLLDIVRDGCAATPTASALQMVAVYEPRIKSVTEIKRIKTAEENAKAAVLNSIPSYVRSAYNNMANNNTSDPSTANNGCNDPNCHCRGGYVQAMYYNNGYRDGYISNPQNVVSSNINNLSNNNHGDHSSGYRRGHAIAEPVQAAPGGIIFEAEDGYQEDTGDEKESGMEWKMDLNKGMDIVKVVKWGGSTQESELEHRGRRRYNSFKIKGSGRK